MERRKACVEIQNAWDVVSAKWSADVKSKYFSQVFLPLLTEAEAIYQRNDDLDDYAEACVNAFRT